jgi:hypothetical protein
MRVASCLCVATSRYIVADSAFDCGTRSVERNSTAASQSMNSSSSVVEDELEDQPLESFTDVTRVVSHIGFSQPLAVHHKNGGEILNQRTKGWYIEWVRPGGTPVCYFRPNGYGRCLTYQVCPGTGSICSVGNRAGCITMAQ